MSQRQERDFIRRLAGCDTSRTIPILKEANLDQWKTIKKMCEHAANGELQDVRMPRKSKRWFNGVVNNRHSNLLALRRATLQRGGSKAELFGTAIKALAKASLPHLKKAGTEVAKRAITAGIQKGSEKLQDKIKEKPKTSQPTDKDILDILNEEV